jgi:serine/threonine-protein kinase HipA
MCQAAGLRPTEKYNIGRPSERMARLLRQFTDSPQAELEKLLRQIAFRVIVGDEDGHGKNYSLLLNEGTASLAPMYDSLCTLVYPELSGKMAAQIGAQATLAKVDRAALLDEAKAMGVPGRDAEACLDELDNAIRTTIEGLEPHLTEGWPSERVAEIIHARLDRLASGQPLGLTDRGSTRSTHTLDEASLRR